MASYIARRKFLATLGGAAAAWPLAARAQQRERVRRIGLLMVHVESDQEGQTLAAAFREGLLKSGWTEGLNIRIDTRWAGGDLDRARSLATELELPLAHELRIFVRVMDKFDLNTFLFEKAELHGRDSDKI